MAGDERPTTTVFTAEFGSGQILWSISLFFMWLYLVNADELATLTEQHANGTLNDAQPAQAEQRALGT